MKVSQEVQAIFNAAVDLFLDVFALDHIEFFHSRFHRAAIFGCRIDQPRRLVHQIYTGFIPREKFVDFFDFVMEYANRKLTIHLLINR